MRADRLISLLLLLQTHGRLTATQLASLLEVSERTIYRDIDALGAAGVPVYGDPGPHGGFSLLDSYRTTLTGMTSEEIRALFMLSIPAPLIELGLSQELKTALLKLNAALPSHHQTEQEHIRQRFYLDTNWWEQPGEAPSHLHTIHQAVFQDRRLDIRHYLLSGVETQQRVNPYGLVAKAGAWYLVYHFHNQFRVRQVAEIRDAQAVGQSFERQSDFDLISYWHAWCADQQRRKISFTVTLRVVDHFAHHLMRIHPNQPVGNISESDFPPCDGWHVLKLHFPSFEDARQRLLGYGRAVEVLEPLALRRSMQDYAEQIVDLYRLA